MTQEQDKPLEINNPPTEGNGNPLEDRSAAEAELEALPAQPEPEIPPSPEEEILRLKLQLDEYKDLFLRKAAEFENYKKRRQQEYAAIINAAMETLIGELLPVLDDLDRLLANAQPSNEANQEVAQSLLRGAQLIRDKLMDLLSARGLKPIDSVGMPFDPELHEALLQQQDSGTEPGIVLQEFVRGYRLGNKVIRHAQVVVSG